MFLNLIPKRIIKKEAEITKRQGTLDRPPSEFSRSTGKFNFESGFLQLQLLLRSKVFAILRFSSFGAEQEKLLPQVRPAALL